MTNSYILKLIVYLIVTCSLIFAPFHFETGASFLSVTYAHADAAAAQPLKWELYSSRPDILKIEALKTKPDESWEALKKAHFSLVANLLEIYPNEHLYFLARDSEYLYDVARLATAGTEQAARIHLLNVSRTNMADPNMKDYLAQEGISDELLRAGKKVVFVDTGFLGSIPKTISEVLSEDVRPKLKTQLIVSVNPSHPSSRTFLIHLSPLVNKRLPELMHGTIVNYEHMPRYTDRSDKYLKIERKVEAISPLGSESDGKVSKSKSITYMQDIRAEWENVDTKKRFAFERNRSRSLSQKVNMLKSRTGYAENIKEIERYIEALPLNERPQFEALIRDMLEVQMEPGDRSLALRDLNLPDEGRDHKKSNAEILAEFPSWVPIIKNPEVQVKKLFKLGKWQLIGTLLDAKLGAVEGVILDNLFDETGTGIKRDMQLLVLRGGDDNQYGKLISIYKKNELRLNLDDLKIIIDHPDSLYGLRVLNSDLTERFMRERPDLLEYTVRRLIGKQHLEELVLERVFNTPESTKFDYLAAEVLNSNDSKKWFFANQLSKKPHALLMPKFLQVLANNSEYYDKPLKYLLSQKNATRPIHALIRESLQVRNKKDREAFLRKGFKNADKPTSKTGAPSCGNLFM